MPLYFAYGSNLDENQMRRRCPDYRKVDKGCLRGYRLSFSRRSSDWGGGVADVIPDGSCKVWGVAYTVSDTDLERLDRYEGYPTAYLRDLLPIDMASNDQREAWVYTVRTKEQFVAPSAAYLDILRCAAMHFGLPECYQRFLASIPLRD